MFCWWGKGGLWVLGVKWLRDRWPMEKSILERVLRISESGFAYLNTKTLADIQVGNGSREGWWYEEREKGNTEKGNNEAKMLSPLQSFLVVPGSGSLCLHMQGRRVSLGCPANSPPKPLIPTTWTLVQSMVWHPTHLCSNQGLWEDIRQVTCQNLGLPICKMGIISPTSWGYWSNDSWSLFEHLFHHMYCCTQFLTQS